MLASISSQTVIEWREYFSQQGFSHQMDNWRFAVSCASNWNITAMAAGVKLDEPVSFRDFLPVTDEPEEPHEYTDEELMAMSESAGGFRIERPDS